MRGKKKSKFVSFLAFILFLFILVAAVGALSRCMNWDDKFKDLIDTTFRVEYNGEKYTGDDNIICFPKSGQAQFTVKGVDSYVVSIRPNVTTETDFTYEIGNTIYNYGQADISKVFIGDDSIKNGSFYLNRLDDYSLESVLSKLHNNAEIKLNGRVDLPYLLIFTANGKTITFKFAISFEFSIELSESSIVF